MLMWGPKCPNLEDFVLSPSDGCPSTHGCAVDAGGAAVDRAGRGRHRRAARRDHMGAVFGHRHAATGGLHHTAARGLKVRLCLLPASRAEPRHRWEVGAVCSRTHSPAHQD
jgi:hypothetical protein